MRIIVCGGRDYADYERIRSVLGEWRDENPTIVHGAAPGADDRAGRAADELGYPVEEHPADWKRWGKAAALRRNEEMAVLGADLLVAFPGGRGTADMIRRARAHGIPVIEEE